MDGLRHDPEKKAIPWFLHSFVDPPRDQLTVQLLALVEGLPSIPGPKTIGPENYSTILDAFIKGGWAAFEEEFDRIVPRGCPNYADLKRDLLCEPIFSIQAHRNLAEILLGRKSVFEAMAQHRKEKPH